MRSVYILMLASLATLVPGCGDDDSTPSNNGTAGTSGNGGSAGNGGVAGSAGTAGTAGSAGNSGSSGTAGTAGTAGAAGAAGAGGTAGAAGSGGAAGAGGTGAGGSGGSGGTAASGGTAGAIGGPCEYAGDCGTSQTCDPLTANCADFNCANVPCTGTDFCLQQSGAVGVGACYPVCDIRDRSSCGAGFSCVGVYSQGQAGMCKIAGTHTLGQTCVETDVHSGCVPELFCYAGKCVAPCNYVAPDTGCTGGEVCRLDTYYEYCGQPDASTAAIGEPCTGPDLTPNCGLQGNGYRGICYNGVCTEICSVYPLTFCMP